MVLSSGQTRPGGNHVGPQRLVRRRLAAPSSRRARIHARTIIDQPIALLPHRRRRAGRRSRIAAATVSRRSRMGRLEGDDLRCMYHGLKFAPDGRCIEIPGQKLIPQSACVRRYPVAVRGSWVWVVDGRGRRGRPGGDPAVAGARRSGLPAESRPSRLRRALPADRRQSPRPFASFLRAREDAGPRHAAMGRRAAAHAAAGARPARAALAAPTIRRAAS